MMCCQGPPSMLRTLRAAGPTTDNRATATSPGYFLDSTKERLCISPSQLRTRRRIFESDKSKGLEIISSGKQKRSGRETFVLLFFLFLTF